MPLVSTAFAVDVSPLGVVPVVVVRDAARYDEHDIGQVLGIGGRDNAAGRQNATIAVVKDGAEGHGANLSTYRWPGAQSGHPRRAEKMRVRRSAWRTSASAVRSGSVSRRGEVITTFSTRRRRGLA